MVFSILVKVVGSVNINDHLSSKHVFFVPSFRYNLLFVRNVINADMAVIFNSSSCLLQDQKINKV